MFVVTVRQRPVMPCLLAKVKRKKKTLTGTIDQQCTAEKNQENIPLTLIFFCPNPADKMSSGELFFSVITYLSILFDKIFSVSFFDF